MPEAARKNPQPNRMMANTRAIRGGLHECLRLADQASDRELKREAMHFINAMEYLAARLLNESTRLKSGRTPEWEILEKLRKEVAHIGELLADNARVANELGDSGAKEVLSKSIESVNHFAHVIEKKSRS